jgi:hypothetical protein
MATAAARRMLEAFEEGRIGVERVGQFGADQTEVAGADEDARVGGVHHGDLDPAHPGDVEAVADVAGGQELAGGGTAGREKIQTDRGAGAGNAGNFQIAVHRGAPVPQRERGADELARVGVEDAHDSGVAVGAEQALVDREGADGGRHVAAVAAVVHGGFADLHLGEGVVDVGVRALRGGQDADL